MYMYTPLDLFGEIELALRQLRQQAKTRRKFPQDLWNAIISLTQYYSIQEVCSRLKISSTALKRKVRVNRNETLDFREISVAQGISVPQAVSDSVAQGISVPQTVSDLVSIEIISDFGLRAKIQGPSSCLSYLSTLLRG